MRKLPNRHEKKKAPRRPTGKKTLAAQADRYELYLRSVQDPDHEVQMMQRVYRDAYKRAPVSLREDFCGTAAVCATWVKSGKDRTCGA